LNLAFIWHMHQPDYRDSSGTIQMPWVFLHAIKDYYDMPWYMARHKGQKATFNITPPLIKQLELYYEEPQNSGKFLNIWLKHPDELNEYDYEWMIKICKSAPYDTMIAPIKSYKRLFHKKHYGVNDFIDLQMLFMLSWCGVYLRRHNETVKRFLKKEFAWGNSPIIFPIMKMMT